MQNRFYQFYLLLLSGIILSSFMVEKNSHSTVLQKPLKSTYAPDSTTIVNPYSNDLNLSFVKCEGNMASQTCSIELKIENKSTIQHTLKIGGGEGIIAYDDAGKYYKVPGDGKDYTFSYNEVKTISAVTFVQVFPTVSSFRKVEIQFEYLGDKKIVELRNIPITWN